MAPFVRRVIYSGRYPEVSFVFAGAGDTVLMKQLTELIYEFPGRVGYNNAFVSNKDPVYYHVYGLADFFNSLSTWEPGGISPMEALAFGVPGMVSDKQGHKSTIRSIYIPELAPITGIKADEPDFNGARFPIDEYNPERTVDYIMLAFDRLYAAWKAREENSRWETLRAHALMSDNSWEKTSEIVEALFKYAMGRREYYRILAKASMLDDASSPVSGEAEAIDRRTASSPVANSPIHDLSENRRRALAEMSMEEGRKLKKQDADNVIERLRRIHYIP
ncbi:MAG: glycosyltransferase, partial [Acidobacteriota bacterium]